MAVRPDSAPLRLLRSSRAFAAGIIIAAALLAYHNSFPGIFVFDDAASIGENASIRSLWPLANALNPPAESGVGGRPLANLTFALNFAISGDRAWSYHAVNVLLHVLCGLLLFGIVRRTMQRCIANHRPSWIALASAALWMVHPLPTAAVNYVSQRTELLAALCFLLTLYAFIRATEDNARSRAWFAVSVAACACGMASKETMITAPLLVLLYDRTFIAGGFAAALRARWPVHVALAGTWALLAWLMIGSSVTERGAGFGLGVSAGDYVLTSCHAMVRYLRLALWPDALVFDYGWDFARALGEAWPQVLFCAAFAAASFVAFWRRNAFGFLGCAFLLLLAPTTSVIPVIQQPLAESRMYLPLAALIAMAVLAVRAAAPRHGWAIVAAMTVSWTALTVERNRDFRSGLALWSDTVAKAPHNARAHNYLGAALLENGRVADAVRETKQAVMLRPNYADAHNNLAIALLRHGQTDEAIAHFETALRIAPRFAAAHYNLGEALIARGRHAEAVTHYEAALALRPGEARTHNNLSVALLKLDRVADAIAHSETALRLDPRFAEAHYNLGNALAAAGRNEDARQHFERTLQLNPAFAKAENNLGVLRLREGDVPGAIARFEAALRIQPNYAEARRNLELAKRSGEKR